MDQSYPAGPGRGQPTVDGPFSLRVRGTDGKRGAPGYHGSAADPADPALDIVGQSDPWEDLWFHSNPIFTTLARAADR